MKRETHRPYSSQATQKRETFQSNLQIGVFQDKSDESWIVEGPSYGRRDSTDKSLGELSLPN